MKRLLLITIVILNSQILFSQNSNSLNDVQKITYDNDTVQVAAEFPGGQQKFNEFVITNLKAPFNNNSKDDVLVSFIVEMDGAIDNVESISPLSNEEKDEIKRVLMSSPKWLPAEHEGYHVKSKVKFKLKL